MDKFNLNNASYTEAAMLLLAGGHLHVLLEIPGCISHVAREEDQRKLKTLENVLDPFAGGGAIPLEAMRLGCEVAAIDINPVAWFILKCTLEYPQKLAGQKRPLPAFVLEAPELLEAFLKAQGYKAKALQAQLAKFGFNQFSSLMATLEEQASLPEADLAWHVRAWGWWVLQRAKADLTRFYPTLDGKSTVAYLWARTVTCKHCRATLPLLKTRWLCKKANKRIVLTMTPNADKTGVIFGVEANVPQGSGNAAQRKEHDKKLGGGTMSRSSATCPCCNMVMTTEDIRLEGQAHGMRNEITASGLRRIVDRDEEPGVLCHTAGVVRAVLLPQRDGA